MSSNEKKAVASFTPGEWFTRGVLVIAGDLTITQGWKIGRPTLSVQAEREANAQLIAAAPELYAACKAFVELFRNSDMRPEDECHEIFALARAALSKAEATNV